MVSSEPFLDSVALVGMPVTWGRGEKRYGSVRWEGKIIVSARRLRVEPSYNSDVPTVMTGSSIREPVIGQEKLSKAASSSIAEGGVTGTCGTLRCMLQLVLYKFLRPTHTRPANNLSAYSNVPA